MKNDLVLLTESILGKGKSYNESTGQVDYCCPNCDRGRKKYKLSINYKKLVAKCWSCQEDIDGIKGSLYSLIKREGTNRDIKVYFDLVKDFEFEGEDRIRNYIPKIFLPKEYRKITPTSLTYDMKMPYNYLRGRGISDEQIQKYEIGFCENGKYGGRIIIPSFSKDGKLNFFTGRSYIGSVNKYKNPEIIKNEIIANEININWDSTVFLVEGMFDLIGIGIKNTIPLLGKILPLKLLETILKKSKGYIVIALDPDAEKEAYKIYKQLDSYYILSGRIRIIKLPNDKNLKLDWSKIREVYGKKGVIKCLRKMETLNFIDYQKYNI